MEELDIHSGTRRASHTQFQFTIQLFYFHYFLTRSTKKDQGQRAQDLLLGKSSHAEVPPTPEVRIGQGKDLDQHLRCARSRSI